MENFDPKVPMFPVEEQHVVIQNHQSYIEMMLTAKSITEWNDSRWIIRDRLTLTQECTYFMLMGYIDNIIFPYKFCRK